MDLMCGVTYIPSNVECAELDVVDEHTCAMAVAAPQGIEGQAGNDFRRDKWLNVRSRVSQNVDVAESNDGVVWVQLTQPPIAVQGQSSIRGCRTTTLRSTHAKLPGSKNLAEPR